MQVTQLEHAIRAKEREVAKAREDRDAGKAAERERAKVIEEVAVRLETDLTAMRVKVWEEGRKGMINNL